MSKDEDLQDSLEQVTDYYLENSDFNGLPLHLPGELDPAAEAEMRSGLERLIRDDKVIIRTATQGNPHIRAIGEDDATKMPEALSSVGLADVVVYPSRAHLEAKLADDQFADRPYTRELALGTGHLDFRAFDVAVLEWYRNDPRYEYQTGDWGGAISIGDEYFQSDAVPERDQVVLKTFGFCFDDEMHRAVAVYCVYLADLSPEHQQSPPAETDRNALPREDRTLPDRAWALGSSTTSLGGPPSQVDRASLPLDRRICSAGWSPERRART